jgi:phosphoribosyl-AMP cyclohydrolase
MNIPEELKFDERGLIPAVIQDCENGEVLMVAYMNREALEKTIATGRTHFYSRSRRELWRKGATSGHVQEVREIRFDCDADCLLVRVKQTEAACHTGYRSCFYRRLEPGGIRVTGTKVFDPEKVYRKKKSGG